MRALKIAVLSALALGLIFSNAFADGDVSKGKALFKDPAFAGGSKACNECHKDGKGLEKAAGKKEFNIMGKTQKSLAEAVNFCIINANKGQAIDPESEQMKDIVAYIKSLKKKAPAGGYGAPGYK